MKELLKDIIEIKPIITSCYEQESVDIKENLWQSCLESSIL